MKMGFRLKPVKKEEFDILVSSLPSRLPFGYHDPWADPAYLRALEMKQELLDENPTEELKSRLIPIMEDIRQGS